MLYEVLRDYDPMHTILTIVIQVSDTSSMHFWNQLQPAATASVSPAPLQVTLDATPTI